MNSPIFLSSPHMGTTEQQYVKDAFDTNWIAPLGPNVDGFETEFAELVGSDYAAATVSGTAALHMALRLVGVGAGDEVLCSSLTFIATASPILYQGAKPVFIDSDRTSWNMDPELLVAEIEKRAKQNRLPKAVVVVHLYGQSADLDPMIEICDRYEIPLIEDAAEALGASYKGRMPGTLGRCGIYSFNGNKIITTSGGGMLVSNDEMLITKSRFLATQARDPAPHYQHSECGYNYRMSNVLAGIGRGQIQVLGDRVAARRRNFERYRAALGDFPGIEFMPEAAFGSCTRWLTALTIDPEWFGVDRETIRLSLAAKQIEARPVWKPLHLQPLFDNCEMVGGKVSEDLFDRGLCLPSGSNLTEQEVDRVIEAILDCQAGRWSDRVSA
jgi:dTDP-4-amino-4,6-dideoxygalactose transaminase